MLKMNNGVKNVLLAGAALALTACANTNDDPITTPVPVEEVKKDVPAVPTSTVTEDPMAPTYALGSQEHLNAIASDALVYFGYDSYALNADARSSLQTQAEWLKEYSDVELIIEGHCDERGTREYNLALGDRRANAVKNFLVAVGVEASRVKVISFGKERPLSVGNFDANRRGYTRVR